MSAKQSNTEQMVDMTNQSIEIGSSPERNSPCKKASDHSINHIISLPLVVNNSKSVTQTHGKSNTSTASLRPNNPNNNFDSMKSKSQSSKVTMNSNIASNHSKVTNINLSIQTESPDKVVHIIKDSSSEDEVQIVDDSPRHVAFASSSHDAKLLQYKRDKIKTSILAKPRPSKSILKPPPNATRDPLAEDDDIRNAESTMNALKELEVGTLIHNDEKIYIFLSTFSSIEFSRSCLHNVFFPYCRILHNFSFFFFSQMPNKRKCQIL